MGTASQLCHLAAEPGADGLTLSDLSIVGNMDAQSETQLSWVEWGLLLTGYSCLLADHLCILSGLTLVLLWAYQRGLEFSEYL